MPALYQKRSHKTGLPPGSLPTETHSDLPAIYARGLAYSKENYREFTANNWEECLENIHEDRVTWIDITGIHQSEWLTKVGNSYNIHPLVLEDISNSDQRPKTEDYEDFIYIVGKMLFYPAEKSDLHVEQVSLILLPKLVISFQEREDDIFTKIRERIKSSRWRDRELKEDYLTFALLDMITDHYYHVLEKIGIRIDDIEATWEKDLNKRSYDSFYRIIHELIFIRKQSIPLQALVRNLKTSDSRLIKNITKPYFDDVYDHLQQINDMTESFRNTIDGIESRYLAYMSQKMNETMQTLTVFASIFMPITFIAGVYGMNFKHMPELDWQWGYYIILGVMIIITLLMLLYFKRRSLL